MNLVMSQNVKELAQKAAQKAADCIRLAINNKGEAAILIATGAAHLEFYKALLEQKIAWENVDVFHLDEYIGISDDHNASFRRYIKENFASKANPRSMCYINPDNGPQEEVKRLSALVANREIDLGVIGIGENGHIAFNDPPADFKTAEPYIIVNLDEACRKQQEREGWFASLPEVPATAITATPSFIMRCKTIVSVVPYKAKAVAVRNVLAAGEITPMLPATILKEHSDWHLFLDQESASLLPR